MRNEGRVTEINAIQVNTSYNQQQQQQQQQQDTQPEQIDYDWKPVMAVHGEEYFRCAHRSTCCCTQLTRSRIPSHLET